ncbi:MAG: sulfatase [Defluviitaleaceae bacterium]|nr:sulfatase [Defluviitaleaceae bacterium]
MRAVMVMYDSLNKHYLSNYGNSRIKTPNFDRLGKRTITFENFFAGSLPCMPARRELHTGRLNFLHRGWTPFEPFDESMPEILSQNGVYSHLITDHCHYWEDGGANYHNRFTSNELIRGQEGDAWIGKVEGFTGQKYGKRQDLANREAMSTEEEHTHARCFERGKEFILNNLKSDNWYLQLEYFDPHEPYFVPERFKRMYTDSINDVDWPAYAKLDRNQEGKEEELKQQQINYAALISMCDEYLGRILDIFDEHDLWKDTMLIVNTDHGYMLGEKDLVGKNYMPVYDEIANTPFFIHIPNVGEPGTRRKAIAQTPDLAPTILKYFGLEKGCHMLGKDISPIVENDQKVHDAILYGYHGMHVNITDGNYNYMRCAQTEDNGPLFQYTLMPVHIRKPMHREELKQAKLFDGFNFCDNVPVLQIPVDERYDKKAYYRYSDHKKYGSLLFDRNTDPLQNNPLSNPEVEEGLVKQMLILMKQNEAPTEQYQRLGLKTDN